MTAWPRIMKPATARKYLDGLDPLHDYGVAPQFFRGEAYYDRAELDRVLDAHVGIVAASAGDDPDALLAAWSSRRGAPARRP